MNRFIRLTALAAAVTLGWPAFAQPVQPVQVAQITESSVSPERRLPGRIEAVHAVDLRSRIEGVITRVHFTDGQQVKQGDLLFELDAAEHRAALSLAQAELRSAQASLRQTQQQLDRYQRLQNTHAISQHDLDGAQMQRDVAQAAVEQAKARVEAREITLSYTRISSPVNGRLGHSQFHQGSLVNPASGTLVDIVQLDPVRIAFAIEEGSFFNKAGQHQNISGLKKAWVPEVELEGQRVAGTLVSIDNRIDSRTGSVTLRGEFANPQQRLLPGGSITIYLRPLISAPALLIPAAAVVQDSQGFYTWVVGSDNKVEQRRFEPGAQADRHYRVASGLKANERVVVEGIQRLRPGASVNVIGG
jgi:RND family efflux transporter MFP subunit